MRLRTRLVMALFLLAVVPLTGASLYAYLTSERAFRRVVAEEAGTLARELGGRMDEVKSELKQRFERLQKRLAGTESTPFAQARRDALAAAEREQFRPVLKSVLADVPRGEGEIPFAVDDQGRVLAAEDGEAGRLEALSLPAFLNRGEPAFFREGFVVVAQRDADLGYWFGIARPVGEAVAQIRSTALRNLGLGLGLVSLALLGILPLSRRITRDLEALEGGAARLAGGDLTARVAVRSKDEIGRLALAFNRMAEDLGLQQERRLAEEGLRRELVTCRRIQAELLPHGPLDTPIGRIDGASFPAREVGGDFFNYFLLPAGELCLLVGDVSGKGIAAALLMANAQAMLRGSIPLAWDLANLAARLDDDLHARTPPEAYLTLFFGVVDPGIACCATSTRATIRRSCSARRGRPHGSTAPGAPSACCPAGATKKAGCLSRRATPSCSTPTGSWTWRTRRGRPSGMGASRGCSNGKGHPTPEISWRTSRRCSSDGAAPASRPTMRRWWCFSWAKA